MDEKHPNHVPRAVSTPRSPSVQAQPARPGATGVSSNKGGEANSGTETSGIVGNSARSTPKLEAASPSTGSSAVLEASRAELDRLLAETQNIHERSWRIIHALLEDSQLKASQAVDACLARFENEIRDRLGSEMATTLQNFDVEASARLAGRLDQALATAKQRQHSIEQDLGVAVAENRKQLDQISTTAADGLRKDGQGVLANLQKEAERHLSELASNARQVTDNLQQLADKFAIELKKSTEEATQLFQSRSEQTWQEIVGRAEKRIAETASTYTTDLAKQARQVVDREMSEFLSHALRRFDRSSNTPSSNHNT
jgi:hypothetical protein